MISTCLLPLPFRGTLRHYKTWCSVTLEPLFFLREMQIFLLIIWTTVKDVCPWQFPPKLQTAAHEELRANVVNHSALYKQCCHVTDRLLLNAFLMVCFMYLWVQMKNDTFISDLETDCGSSYRSCLSQSCCCSGVVCSHLRFSVSCTAAPCFHFSFSFFLQWLKCWNVI